LDADGVRPRLLTMVRGVERLVLLGDVVELRERPWREALRASEPTLEAIGDALPAGGSVLLVAGNHDHGLLAAPQMRRAVAEPPPAPLGTATTMEAFAGDPLGRVCAALGTERVTVSYPGVWLRDDVYATHGHYLDRHTTVPTLERLAIGAVARVAGGPPGGPASAEDYEALMGPVYAWLDAYAGTGGRTGQGASVAAWRALGQGDRAHGGLRQRALRATFPAIVAGLNRAGLGPVSADVSIDALRGSSLAAIGEVLLRLRVAARFVIFGHTHRAGPLPEDDPGPWRTSTGVRLVNCGCWVGERTLAGGDRDSPYRPGFCVALDDDRDPELINLLD
jgi:predicted phosphodiesterase